MRLNLIKQLCAAYVILALSVSCNAGYDNEDYDEDEESEDARQQQQQYRIIKSASDAFELVFSVINLDEKCRRVFENCVLNENNNEGLNMVRNKCDVFAKSMMCTERANFLNSECNLASASLDAKLKRYAQSFGEFLKKCDSSPSIAAQSIKSRLDSRSSNLSNSAPASLRFFFLSYLRLIAIFLCCCYYIFD